MLLFKNFKLVYRNIDIMYSIKKNTNLLTKIAAACNLYSAQSLNFVSLQLRPKAQKCTWPKIEKERNLINVT